MTNLKFRKVIAVFIFVLFIVPFIPKQVFAATVGQALIAPETGWRRYDDTDSKISYSGGVDTWFVYRSSGFSYNSTYTQKSGLDEKISFTFVGTKLRIVGNKYNDKSTNIEVIVDGISKGTYSQYGSNNGAFLLFEVVGLENGNHTCSIVNKTSSIILLDAIDIDDTGYLIDPAQNVTTPTNLVATQNNLQINLSWDTVTNATSYNVKRATTAGGSYTTIATNITTTTYTDTSVENNVTYYYVVSALNGDIESPNSNEVSVSVVIDSSRVLLTITMVNGAIKEYDLSSTELTNFVNWYDSKANGVGKAYYKFTRTYSTQPTKIKYEYIIFDKINYFEVSTY